MKMNVAIAKSPDIRVWEIVAVGGKLDTLDVTGVIQTVKGYM